MNRLLVLGVLSGLPTNITIQPASPPGSDPRTTSIQVLRMRAKEHEESMTKGLHYQRPSDAKGLQMV